MLTWTSLQTFYTDNTNDNVAANVTFGKSAMNRGYHKLVRAGSFDFPESRTALVSVSGTYVYTLPPQFSKIKEVVWERTGGSLPLLEVGTLRQWDAMNYSTSSGDPTHYMVRKAATGAHTWELWLWPTPATSAINIRVTYLRNVPDLSAEDYSTGTVTLTNASATMTGAGTTFTAAMVGRSVKLPDGLWYDIGSFTSTTVVTLTYPYQGASGASQAYLIGDTPIIPEPHQDAIWQYGVGEYYEKRREEDAKYWFGKFNESLHMLERDRKNRTANQIISGNDNYRFRTVNRYPMGPL
jgi:hypothetical protein